MILDCQTWYSSAYPDCTWNIHDDVAITFCFAVTLIVCLGFWWGARR